MSAEGLLTQTPSMKDVSQVITVSHLNLEATSLHIEIETMTVKKQEIEATTNGLAPQEALLPSLVMQEAIETQFLILCRRDNQLAMTRGRAQDMEGVILVGGIPVVVLLM